MPGGDLSQTEFTLMVYNVENFFDLDGISIFDEYVQDSEKNNYPYTPDKLLTKVNHASEIIQSCNDGLGPDIIAIQEFENDFSQDPAFDLQAALESHRDVTLADLLKGMKTDSVVMGYPVEFFLLKRLQELGVGDYHLFQPEYDATWFDRGIAHRSVFLSRFEAISIRQHSLKDARDILEVTFDVHGSPFTVFNNHWKSGASSKWSEPTRVQNATVLRALVDERLQDNPSADIVLVGDFNSHHNQDLRMGDVVEVTAMNGVLRSQSSERALLTGDADLYNLWYELPQQQRGSEVWGGEWGTLMQIVVTPGLYDSDGVQYVDGSFNRVAIMGKNLSEDDQTPVSWVNLGTGAGYSDHLPVIASFRYASEAAPLMPYSPQDLGNEREVRHVRIPVDQSLEGRAILMHPEQLSEMTVNQLQEQVGKLYFVTAEKMDAQIKVGDTFYGVYVSHSEARERWKAIDTGETVEFVGRFGVYRGNLQFVIEDPSWLDWTPGE